MSKKVWKLKHSFCLRYNHIKSFGTGMKQFPKASSGFSLGGGAAPAAAAADDDDDVDLFGSRFLLRFFHCTYSSVHILIFSPVYLPLYYSSNLSCFSICVFQIHPKLTAIFLSFLIVSLGWWSIWALQWRGGVRGEEEDHWGEAEGVPREEIQEGCCYRQDLCLARCQGGL